MEAERPDLLILPALEPEEPSFVSFVERCVERGYFFPFDSQHHLPATLPDDLSAFKAIVLDPRVGWTRIEAFKRRLDAFVEGGGRIFEWETIEPFTRELDNPMVGWLDFDLPVAGVRQHHPGLRARLGGQDDQALLRSLAQAAFDPREQRPVLDRGKASERFLKEGDVGIWWSRRAMLRAATYLRDEELLDRLRQWVDRFIVTVTGPPFAFYGVGDAVVYLYFHERTGDSRYVDYMIDRAEHVLTNVRRVDGVVTYHTWLTAEACAMVAPGLAALGVALGRERYLEEALRLLHVSHIRLFDPAEGLWFHGAAPGPNGQKAASKWGRGQGWALYGLAHTLDVLPEGHPERAWLAARLAEVAEALRPLQDERTGCWPNVLTLPESGLETSATAMFVKVYSLAWMRGWCHQDFIPDMVKRAWVGVKCRTFRNRNVGWVPGTGLSPDARYYVTRPRVSMPAFILGAATRYLEAFG